MSGLGLCLMLVQDLQSSEKSLFFCSLHGPFFNILKASAMNQGGWWEYEGIYRFTALFAVLTDFFFRAAWMLPTPQVQHKSFDALAQELADNLEKFRELAWNH